MKKIKIALLSACVLLAGGAVSAQGTIYDATRLLGSDLNGTARYVGMGGAMGALGADITTMGTNPAGIGLYRSSDAMVSFGFGNSNVKSQYSNSQNQVDHFYGSFDNAGIIYAYKVGNHTPLRYVNFGFNYRRTKNFDRNVLMNGTYLVSQTDQMADMATSAGASTAGLESNNAYSNPRLPWLGIMGYNSYLINPMYNDDEPNVFSSLLEAGDEIDGVYQATERGGVNEFDFNVSFNVNDRFYVGATLGAYYVDYTRRSTYNEDFFYQDNGEWMTLGGYTLDNYYNVTGSGIDFKLGFILRPFEMSPFRIGAAVHTPTFYRLTEYGTANLNYDVDVYNSTNATYEGKTGTVFPYDNSGNQWQSETRYRAVSPWKYNLSLGYTVGSVAALGVEYEYADYSTTKMKYDDGVTMEQETQDATNMLKGVHTIKLGAEFKLSPAFAVRVGYNHVTAAMKDDAFKWLPSNSVRTDTEYSNLKAVNNYTCGLGYRGNYFYADLAYQHNAYKEHFYAFTALDNNDVQMLDKTKVTNRNNRVVMTLGVRF